MFKPDNCEFDAAARHALNGALALLMADRGDVDEHTEAQLEKSYSDALNNAWTEGATMGELFNRVSRDLNLGRSA